MTREQKKQRRKKYLYKKEKTKDLFIKDIPAGILIKTAVVIIPKDETNDAAELIVKCIVLFTESGDKALFALGNIGKKICGHTNRILFVNY